MDKAGREQLARRLSEMRFHHAQREMRRLDDRADMKTFRNSIWNEYHTIYVLPTVGVKVVLVERVEMTETDLPEYSRPRGSAHRDATKFSYVEARVEPLDRPVPAQ